MKSFLFCLIAFQSQLVQTHLLKPPERCSLKKRGENNQKLYFLYYNNRGARRND